MRSHTRTRRFVMMMDDEEHSAFRRLADQHGLPIAQLIRLRVLGDWAPREGEDVPSIDQ